MIELLVTLACLVAAALAALRWLRVVQREQYYVSAVRFARRWWLGLPLNVAIGALAVAGAAAASLLPASALLTAGAIAAGPLGLGLRGRSAPLVWRPRMLRLVAVLALANVLLFGLLVLVGAALALEPAQAAVVAAAALALFQPLVVDLAVALTWPIERRLMDVFVRRAMRRLEQVRPTVVAITGSYGKTSTKGYVRQLVSAARTVVASPASFNNTGGLARAVNEHLLPGTEVFVAEMGTYGRGEIRDLCRWLPPDVAVITAIGPVHLERMGSLDTIVQAKAEILELARTCVLNVDAHGLAEVAAAVPADRIVWRCSEKDESADVFAALDEAGGTLRVVVRGTPQAEVPAHNAQPINVACAVAVALALDVPEQVVAERLAGLPSAEHRLQVASGANGATVIDDTYNSNPAGSRAALAALRRLPARRRVVVTPGMIELGSTQAAENERFARAVAEVADELLIVNRTNRAALSRGAADGVRVRHFDRREQAVAWVRANLGPGDAVLYENDLPDTYP